VRSRRVQRAQDRIAHDAGIEAIDESGEERHAADRLVERDSAFF